MPFQGNPNAGAPDPGLISLLFAERDKRRQAERQAMLDQAKMQQDAAKFAAEQAAAARKEARLDQAHRLKMITGLLDKAGPAVDAARRNAENVRSNNLTREDLLDDGGGQDFASIMFQNDPTAAGQVQESDEATAHFRGIAGGTANLFRGVDPSMDERSAMDAALGAGGSFEANRVRTAGIAKQEKIDDEKRQEQKERRSALLADSLRDGNIISDATGKALGNLNAVDELQANRNSLKKTANRLKAAGADTTDIEEKISVIDGQIRAIRDPRTVRNVSPIPFEAKERLVKDFMGADFVLDSVQSLYDAYQSGSIQAGLTGRLTNFRAVASDLISQALNDSTFVDADGNTFANSEVGQMLSKIRLADGAIPIDLPKQLTLGLEQIALAYAFSRMGRGNARFTIKEMSEISKQIGLTSAIATPESIQGALVKVGEAAVREKTGAFFLLGDDPDFRDQLSALENIPADQALVDRMKSESMRPGAKSNKPAGTGRDPKSGSGAIIDPRTVRDSELLQMFPRGGRP